MTDQITIEGLSKTFPVAELSSAIRAASAASKRKSDEFIVKLPVGELCINEIVNVDGTVKLAGQDGTKLLFVENGLLKASNSLTLENLEVSREKTRDASSIICSKSFSATNVIFTNNSLSTEEGGGLNLDGCKLVATGGNSTDGFGLLFNGNSRHVLNNCEISGYKRGISFSQAKAELSITESKISATELGLDVKGNTTIDQCTISVPHGIGIIATGEKVKVQVNNTEFTDFKVGVSALREVTFIASACNLDGGDDAEVGFNVDDGGIFEAIKGSIKNVVSGVCGSMVSEVKLNEFVIEDVKTGITISTESKIEANGVTLKNIKETGIKVEGQSTGVIKQGTVENCKIGVHVTDSALLQLEGYNCKKFGETAAKVVDAGLQIRGGKVVNGGKGSGVTVNFNIEGAFKVLLRDYIAANCGTGAWFEDAKGDDKKMASMSTLENCVFLQCGIGCHVDRSAVDIHGCTFAMNKKRSITIHNQVLKNVGQLRKEARLRIRWVNIVEKRFDDGDQISNDNVMFSECQEEKEFRVLQEFESVLYRDILSERLKQAMNFFRSRDIYSMNLARVIMKSVAHCLKFIKELKGDLLQNELLESPTLGMFTATFKLETKVKGKTNTLIHMDDLLDSWQELKRVSHFDDALNALDEAFNRKQIDDDIYDEWISPLEEMQREVFVGSKYNRRRDYLLEKSKQDPLSAWYFLVKEDKTKEEGRKLRREILHYLAASFPVYGSINFNSSWVGQWAVHDMGSSFREERIPDEFNLRRAWANSLLDHGNASELLTWYNNTTYLSEMDQLMQYEAYRQVEATRRLKGKEVNRVQKLFNGGGSTSAIQTAARMFSGNGALPGYIRRTAEKARDIEEVLVFLKPAYEDHVIEKWRKERVCVATLAHFFMRDPTTSPKILGTKDVGYETCPMCFVQKLQPWNELKLSECKHNHVFCINCLKQSMSQGVQELWGRCPGTTDEGEECTAYANRREMEMSGMDNNKVFNILRVRVHRKLNELPGWRDCTHCRIGGKANVKKGYFVCKLCDNLVTEDGGESDPTVRLKLLEGLGPSKSPRGKGVYRECFHCASPYEKGDACSTITCANCRKQFSMTWGNQKVNHSFDNDGIGPQRYVPAKAGSLWKLDVFKNRKGGRLKLGQQLSEAEAKEVLRRANIALNKLKL